MHFAGTVYWTGATVQTFGGLPGPIAVVVALLLVFYLALYVALASGITARARAPARVGGLPLALPRG